MRLRLVLVLVLCIGGIAATGLSSLASSPSCWAAQKAQRARVAAAFAKQIPVARAAYFKTHKRTVDRASFVKRQRVKLAQLRSAAACTVPPPPPLPTTTAPGPVATQETFVFGTELSTAAQDEIRGDADFAVRDEAALLGTALTTVSIFASTNGDWLADQECRFTGHDDDSCRRGVQQRWASGSSTAVGGPGAAFLDWASTGWQGGAGENQKIIGHELFHVFQYQLDKLVRNGETPSNQVRASGPVWLDEGAPEMLGYHVASDRGLTTYRAVLASQIARMKQISQPLNALQTYDDQNFPNAYSLFHVAVDHLVSIAPGGLTSLTAYYNALGNGTAWPAAFASAFGLSVDAYYSSFAAYRSTF